MSTQTPPTLSTRACEQLIFEQATAGGAIAEEIVEGLDAILDIETKITAQTRRDALSSRMLMLSGERHSLLLEVARSIAKRENQQADLLNYLHSLTPVVVRRIKRNAKHGPLVLGAVFAAFCLAAIVWSGWSALSLDVLPLTFFGLAIVFLSGLPLVATGTMISSESNQELPELQLLPSPYSSVAVTSAMQDLSKCTHPYRAELSTG